MPDFVHLHLHSEYSLLGSTIQLDHLLARLEALNMNACAITDSGNMSGAARFYFVARERGIKPIIGSEMFVAPGSRFSQARKDGRPRPHHLVLIAYNNKGYRNLMKLSSLSHLEGYYYGPRVDKVLLAEYNEGLICLSGCLSGEIPRLARLGTKKELYAAVEEYLSIFGDRLYFELQNNGYKRQKEVNECLTKLSKHFEIPIVATNNCHYLELNEKEAYEILIAIRRGKTLDKIGMSRLITNELHLRSGSEMKSVFSNYPEALSNTLRIAEMCDVAIDTETWHVPEPVVPDGMDIDGYLGNLSRRGLEGRLAMIQSAQSSGDGVYQTYRERLDHELAAITKSGFSSYFTVVADFVNWARTQSIPVGPGRGSIGSSLIAYCLGITDIDPIKHDLMFERFFNPERITMPDIDIDFCHKRRDEVIHYITEKYGKERVAGISTFGTRRRRAAVRDVGKALGIPPITVDKVIRLVSHHRSIEQAINDEPKLRKLYESSKRIGRLLDNARVLEGIVSHTSTHAAGIIVSDEELSEYVPLCRDMCDNTITQYDMRMTEKIGFIEFDLLGLDTLTLIDDVVNRLADEDTNIDLSRIPLDDERTYDLLSSGDTLGVFQLESKGMLDILVKLKPSRFSDIAALIALYRPGPLKSGMVDEFISRKNDPPLDKKEPPKLADILQETYGVIIYQEQIMRIATALAGFSMKEADTFRRIIGKKMSDQIERYKKRFADGAVANGVPKDVAEEVYDTIVTFGEYGFNKPHAVAYGLIAYRTAYLKANYYRHYMAALLTNESGDDDKIREFIKDCERHGANVLPLDINKSDYNFSVEGDHIRSGFVGVEGIDAAIIERILDTRKTIGKFESWKQFQNAIDLKPAMVDNFQRTIRACERNRYSIHEK